MTSNKKLDVVAFGTCYVDTNAHNFPFSSDGVPNEKELIGSDYEIVPGGSAVNFCRMLAGMHLQTAFIGMAGQDINGDILEELLQEQGVQASLIRRKDLQTNIGFAVTNEHGGHIMFVAGTANAALGPNDVLPQLTEVLPEARVLYIGGCFKLVQFMRDFSRVADMACNADTQLAIDHGRVPHDASEEMRDAIRELVLRAAFYLPSKEEFCTLWGTEDVAAGLQKLHEQAPNLLAVVKDGPKGALFWHNGTVGHVPAQTITNIRNLTGAGDSFNAGFMAAILHGKTVQDAADHAINVASAHIQSLSLPTVTE